METRRTITRLRQCWEKLRKASVTKNSVTSRSFYFARRGKKCIHKKAGSEVKKKIREVPRIHGLMESNAVLLGFESRPPKCIYHHPLCLIECLWPSFHRPCFQYRNHSKISANKFLIKDLNIIKLFSPKKSKKIKNTGFDNFKKFCRKFCCWAFCLHWMFWWLCRVLSSQLSWWPLLYYN